MKIQLKYGHEQPQTIVPSLYMGLKSWVFSIRCEYSEKDGVWHWTEVETEGPVDYDRLVSAFVRLEYSDDKMWSIVNNYMCDPEGEDHKSEWEAMQNCRGEAKTLAKTLIAQTK